MWLRQMGAEVTGVALEPPSTPSMYHALRLDELIKGIRLDLRDYAGFAAIMNEVQPEIIFHMAAQALVRPSYQDPLHTLHTNIMGTAHVLEACRHTPSVRSVVIVTSDKCYHNNEWVWGYRENDPMGGHAPYNASKACAELITASYIKSFFPTENYGKTHQAAVASARAGNAIGGGDWGKDRLVPDCFKALYAGRSIHLRYPKAVRQWQHVLECLCGYLLLGFKLAEHGPQYGCGWNFAPLGMGDVWPVERVAKFICELWGDGRYDIDTASQPHEDHLLRLDCTKANIELGWRPHYNIAQALDVTTKWYKAWADNPDPAHMREVTLRQIQEYVDAAPEKHEADLPHGADHRPLNPIDGCSAEPDGNTIPRKTAIHG
jgi:CDP-glucose 4,6-dehydratase